MLPCWNEVCVHGAVDPELCSGRELVLSNCAEVFSLRISSVIVSVYLLYTFHFASA
jgi:hypothetical protein